MAKGFIEDTTLTAIADAIRVKTGASDLMLPENMAELISNISNDNVVEMTYTLSSDVYGSKTAYLSIPWPQTTRPDFLLVRAADDSYAPTGLSYPINVPWYMVWEKTGDTTGHVYGLYRAYNYEGDVTFTFRALEPRTGYVDGSFPFFLSDSLLCVNLYKTNNSGSYMEPSRIYAMEYHIIGVYLSQTEGV